jgi:hypothetical protein
LIEIYPGNVNGGKVVSSGLVTVPISFRSTALNRSAPDPSYSEVAGAKDGTLEEGRRVS